MKIRASQINGCAFCLHMHTRDARKAGESQERLDLIGAWREAPVYSSRERAALAWTEAVTRVADTHVPDDVYDTARAEFSERELVDLTMAVVAINGWNRLMVAFRIPPPSRATPEPAQCRGSDAICCKATPSRIVMRPRSIATVPSRRRCASTRHTVSIVSPR